MAGEECVEGRGTYEVKIVNDCDSISIDWPQIAGNMTSVLKLCHKKWTVTLKIIYTQLNKKKQL